MKTPRQALTTLEILRNEMAALDAQERMLHDKRLDLTAKIERAHTAFLAANEKAPAADRLPVRPITAYTIPRTEVR